MIPPTLHSGRTPAGDDSLVRVTSFLGGATYYNGSLLCGEGLQLFLRVMLRLR
jgi:hypothetical protein